jgi:hypothetical protein
MARGGRYLWDPLAAAAAVQPELVRTAVRRVDVAPSGQTRIAAAGTRVRVAVAALPAAVERALLATLLRGGRFAIAPDRPDVTLSYDRSGCTFGGRRSP